MKALLFGRGRGRFSPYMLSGGGRLCKAARLRKFLAPVRHFRRR